MIQRPQKTIRRLPDVVGVSNDLGGFFSLDECQASEVVVRRGQCKSRNHGIADVVFAHCADDGDLSAFVVKNFGNGWEFEKGAIHEELNANSRRAIESVIGEPLAFEFDTRRPVR